MRVDTMIDRVVARFIGTKHERDAATTPDGSADIHRSRSAAVVLEPVCEVSQEGRIAGV